MRITQRKGDTATSKAIHSFTKFGWDVSIPLTESAAYDLIVDTGNKLFRVQVKFSKNRMVGLRRIHSNARGYVVKKPQENVYDWLYVLCGDDKEYLIDESLAGRSYITMQEENLLDKFLARKV